MTLPENGFEINTIKDVEQLFLDLNEEYGVFFRPNEDFFCVQNLEGDYLFGDRLAEALNEAMIRCAQVCNAQELNIYEFVRDLRERIEGAD